MRGRSSYKKRHYIADHVYKRADVARFINYLMVGGEKSKAEKVFYSALDKVKEITKEDGIKVFEKAVENVSPLLEVVSARVGGANYQIPREVRPNRQFFLAARWLIDFARKKKGKPMHMRLAEELAAAFKNEGSAIKKKQDTHRMAEANRAFASFKRR